MSQPQTPLLDRITLARLVVDDFPLTDDEREILADPEERYRLEDALREVFDMEAAAVAALDLWRERRGQ